MDGMFTFIGWIIIIFGILQIILFFKVWEMTNNVAKISKKIGCNNSSTDSIRKLLLKGENKKAYETIIESMILDIDLVFSGESSYESIEDVRQAYSKGLEKIGYSIPDPIKNINSYDDYKNLYK